ncbi:TetR/AcrR family transcriptional regulator [Deinococcus sp. PESE-13]
MSPRQRLSSDTRREQILDTALGLFIEQGFAQVSPREIAAAIGTSRPNVYTYFPSTEAILDTLLERLTAQYFAELDRRFAEVKRPDARLTFEVLLTQRDLLLLLQSGGGPLFQATRARVMARMDERTRNTEQLIGAPKMVLLTRVMLFSVATAILQNPELDAERLGELIQQLLEVGFRTEFAQA